RPDHAGWLSAAERDWLIQRLQTERCQSQASDHQSLLSGLTNPRVRHLNAVYFMLMFGLQGLILWLPSLIKDTTGATDDLHIGLLTAIPCGAAAVAMSLVGRHSDRTAERRWHVALSAVAGALGLVGCALSHSPAAGVACLAVAAAGILATLGPFW